MASASSRDYSRMLLSFLALRGLAVGKFARMLFSFLFRHLFAAWSVREGYKDAFQLLVSALVRGGSHCLHLAPSEQKQFSVPCIFFESVCVV
jgi:hypothetical protein